MVGLRALDQELLAVEPLEHGPAGTRVPGNAGWRASMSHVPTRGANDSSCIAVLPLASFGPRSLRVPWGCRILGPLQALDDGQPVALGGSKQRALLALLLLHVNEPLSTERLIDELWGDRPPAMATKALQVHVARRAQSTDRGRRGGRGGDARARLRAHPTHRVASTRSASTGWWPKAGRRWARASHNARSRRSPRRSRCSAGRPLADLAHEPFARSPHRPPGRPAGRRARAAHRDEARTRSRRRGRGAAGRADRRASGIGNASAPSRCSRSTAAIARRTRCTRIATRGRP